MNGRRLYNTQEAADIINRLTHTTASQREIDQSWIRERITGKSQTKRTQSGTYTYRRINLLEPGRDFVRIAGRIMLSDTGIRKLTEERREQLHNPNSRDSRFWERVN